MCEENNAFVRHILRFDLIPFHLKNRIFAKLRYKLFNSFPISAGALYVRNFFNRNSKQSVKNIVKSIHKAFLASLNSVDWMDEKTRELAIEKAHGMHFHIAYPNELLDDNKLNEYYDGLAMQPDSLLHNVMRVRQFIRNRKISQFCKTINRTDWQMHSAATAVNAYNSLMGNSVRMFLLR